MVCNSIKDINKFKPIDNTKPFFLDTNVLYWYTYPRFSNQSDLPTNAIKYYDFVDDLVAAGNPLYTSVYNLTELINVVEKNEFELFKELNSDIPYTKKDYRKLAPERSSVEQILNTTISNVRNTCTVVSFDFEMKYLDMFIGQLSDHRCDVFDYVILRKCIEMNKLNIISDDSDFSTMELINLHTANSSVI